MNMIKILEYEVLNEVDLQLLLRTLLEMGSQELDPILSFSYDRYTHIFKIKGTETQLRKWVESLNANQKNYLDFDHC